MQMRNIDQCLVEIDKLRQVANGSEPAYVARSRISRLIVMLSRMVAQVIGTDSPNRPGLILIPTKGDPALLELVRVCNELLSISKTITQPSEPLAERWTTGWAIIMNKLSELESQLKAIRLKGVSRLAINRAE